MKNRVCICSSLYNLMIYLLITDLESTRTYYFLDNTFPNEICERLPAYYKEKHFNNHLLTYLYYLYIRIFKFIKWPFLRGAVFWGADHTKFSWLIIGTEKINIIEDGVRTYIHHVNSDSLWKKVINRLVLGPLSLTNSFGEHSQVNKIFLTGIMHYDKTSYDKIKYVDLKKEWHGASEKKKNYILSIFNITDDDFLELRKRKAILFTQPLSEDKLMSEREKIEIYKILLKNETIDNLVVRPHPREITNYSQYFKGCFVYDKKIPFEMLLFNGVRFNKAYTLFSTIVYSMPLDTEIIFGGTEMHVNLVKRFGNIHGKIFYNK